MADKDDEVDDISKDIEDAIAATEAKAEAPAPEKAEEAPAPAKEETPAPAPEKAASAAERDEQGRFAAKAEQPEAAPEAAPAQEGAEQPGVEPAPMGWRGGAKTKWDKLPQAIRKEIAEDYKRLEEMNGKQQRLDQVLTPQRVQALSANYGSVEQGLGNLFALSDMATQNPQGFLLWFAQQRGIDLTQIAGQGQGEQGEIPQQPNRLEQQVGQLQTLVNNFIQQQTTTKQSEVQQSIEAFARDPAHPYFTDVREDMAALLNQGRAKDLQDAYDKAIWANPDVRVSLLEDQQKKATEAQAAQVRRAKEAKVSITGTPGGKTPDAEELDQDLEGLVRKLADKALA